MEKFSYANLSTAEGQREVFGRKADYNNVHHYNAGVSGNLSARDVSRTLKFVFTKFAEACTFHEDVAMQLCAHDAKLASDLRQVTVELRCMNKRYWRRFDGPNLFVLVCIYRNYQMEIPSGEGIQT